MKKGFTILEVLIVIIIIGVLTSLALPKMFMMVEGARAAEAVAAIGTIRAAMERCFLMNNGSYSNCYLNKFYKGENTLDIEDPGNSPGAHFSYLAYQAIVGAAPLPNYYILATRNTVDGGDGKSGILMGVNMTASFIEGSNGDKEVFVSFSMTPNIVWDAYDIYKGFVPKN